MRNLWIGLLTILAHRLQTWSEAVTRRIERSQRAADPVQVVDESEISMTDGRLIESHRPPVDWSERVKAAQPPAHWQAKVQRSRSDSTAFAPPSDPDATDESTPTVDQIENQPSDDVAPVASPSTRSILQPAVPAKQLGRLDLGTANPIITDDQIASDLTVTSNVEIDLSPEQTNVAPRENERDVAPVAKPVMTRSQRKIEMPAVKPQSTRSDSSSESDAPMLEAKTTLREEEVTSSPAAPSASWTEPEPTMPTRSQREMPVPLKAVEHSDDDQPASRRFVSETRDLPKPDRSQLEPKTSYTESLPDRHVSPMATDSPHRAASMPERIGSIDLTYPPESPVERETLASPSTRHDVEVNDPFTTHWPLSRTDQSIPTWATITGVKAVELESSAFDQRWPTLPDEPSAVDDDFEIVLRERERLQRLDLEQRGLAWNA